MSSDEEKRKIRNVVYQADAFRISFAMARLVYARLQQTLVSIEPRFQNQGSFDSEIASAFNDAWALVDILHRVRNLAEQTRLVSAKLPQVQLFLRASEPVKELRNHVQHFRSGIHDLPDKAEPLFGTLSWVPASNPQQCYSIMSGTPVDGVASQGSTYDRVDREFLQKLRLAAGKGDLDLHRGFVALENFARYLNDSLGLKGAKSLIEGPLGLAHRQEFRHPETSPG